MNAVCQAWVDSGQALGKLAHPSTRLLPPQSYLPVGGAYFASERSFAQYKLPDAGPCLVGFGAQPCTLLLVSHTGGALPGWVGLERA